MIFVTVGTQEPFDRLVSAVDTWAGRRGYKDIFAQIGSRAKAPTYVPWVHLLSPEDFQARIESATVIVSHAGMGTILTAMSAGKRILVMPRLARLHEHRNDHQMATVKKLESLGLVISAQDEVSLVDLLDRIEQIVPREPIRPFASTQLLDRVRAFLTSPPQT